MSMQLPIPTTILLAVASIGVLLGRFLRIRSNRICGSVMLATIVVTAIVLILVAKAHASVEPTSQALWAADPLSFCEQGVVLLLGLFTSLAVFDSRDTRDGSCNSRGLILFVIGGLMSVATANDLISLGLSLEIVNLALWGLQREVNSPARPPRWSESSDMPLVDSDQSVGASVPGVGFSTIASAMIWLGIALLANAVATTRYDAIRFVLTNSYAPTSQHASIGTPSNLILLAAGLITLGLIARISLVTFLWSSNDRDLRSRDWMTGFSIAVGQLAGAIALTRLLGLVFVTLGAQLAVLVMSISLATFVLAPILGIRAVSSDVRSIPLCLISLTLVSAGWFGAGLMTIAIESSHSGNRWGTFAGQNEALCVVVFTQLATVCVGGCFAWTLGHLSGNERPIEFLEDLRGLGRRSPLAAASLAIGILCAVGCPLTVTFWARWLLLLAGYNGHGKSASNLFAPHDGLRILILTGMISTGFISLAVIRLGREMFFESPLARPTAVGGRGLLAAGTLSAAACILLGIAPDLALGPLRQIPFPRVIGEPSEPTGSGSNSVGSAAGSGRTTTALIDQ